jgi:putative hydrolase of the HAD superfamily
VKNEQLWEEYGKGTITKNELNAIRYAHPFRVVGAYDQEFVETYKKDYMSRIAFKEKMMPHTREALEYLYSKYNLYILSNGFRELQTQKLRSAKVDHLFKKIILSEDIGVHKPNIQIYHFALSATQSELKESLMIGDNWNTDIVGAQRAGMHCIYYNPNRDTTTHNPKANYEIADWLEVKDIL